MILLCYETVLEYWRLARKRCAHSTQASDNSRSLFSRKDWKWSRVKVPTFLPTEEFLESEALRELTFPIDLMLQGRSGRRVRQKTRQHIYEGPTPFGCFLRDVDDLVISAPEFCYFQMARKLSLVGLIELGFEFCGSYSLPAKTPSVEQMYEFGQEQQNELWLMSGLTKDSVNGPPLTDVKRLKVFASKMNGVQGYRKVNRALCYVIEGAASPMETKLAMLLTLPYKMGGYGFAQPQMNMRFDPTKSAKLSASKKFHTCDLFWPDHDLVVEYDSDLYHTGSARIAGDSKKRNTLVTMGNTVITITKQQLMSTSEFDKVARQIAAHQGKKLQYKVPNFYDARLKLRGELLRF